jgi:amphiphysin
MQSMQRKFGKLLNKAPGDNAKVSVVLNDYEDADKVLAKVQKKPADCPPREDAVR